MLSRKSFETFVAERAIDSLGGSERIIVSDSGTKYTTPDDLTTFVTSRIIDDEDFRLGINAERRRTYNISDYGVQSDYKVVLTGSITSGSNLLSINSNDFSVEDEGKLIAIAGAGTSGGVLYGEIDNFVSEDSVEISVDAVNTVSGEKVEWATDDTDALLDAITAAGPEGYVIGFNNGTCVTRLPLIYDSRTAPGSFATGAISSNGTNVSNGDTVTIAGLAYTFRTALTEAYATGDLTSNGSNVSNGDMVTIGFKTYTFKSSLTGTKATGTLTSSGVNVSDGDRVVVAGIVYTFKTSLTGASYEVLIGANSDASLTNLASAINASAGAGVVYGTGTAVNTGATSAAAPVDNVLTITAINAGTFGNSTSLSTTASTLTASGTTLSGGAATAAYEVLIGANSDASLTNLVAAINGSAGEGSLYSRFTKPNFMASMTGPVANVVSLTAKRLGNVTRDAVTLSTTAVTLTPSGATLSGGVNPISREVLIGADANESLINLSKAINGFDGKGIKFSYSTRINESVICKTEPASHVLTLHSIIIGDAANRISLKKTASTLTVSDAYMSGGVDDVGETSLAPSLIGVPGRSSVSVSQGTKAAVRILAWYDFPLGEFLIDYIAASLVDVCNIGYQVSGFDFDCNDRAAGVRSFNSNNSTWRDFIVNNCTVAPSPENHVGNPQGAVNGIAEPSVAAYLNHYQEVYAAGPVARDGFYIREGNGSYVRLTNCVTSLCGRFGFNTDSATVLVDCNSHGSLVADYAPAGSLLVGCKMVAATGGNAIHLQDFISGLTRIVGGEYIGCGTPGKNEAEAALIYVGIGATFPHFDGVLLRASTQTSTWVWADSAAGSLISLDGCTLYINNDGQHDLGTQKFNDHRLTSESQRILAFNNVGLNPHSYFKATISDTYEIDRANGVYQRLFCSAHVALSINPGAPGDVLTIALDPNNKIVTFPSNIVLAGAGTYKSRKLNWLNLAWDSQDQVWYETGRNWLGMSLRGNARVVATTNISKSGTTTIDGVSLSVGDRVLLTGQTITADNGLWVVQTGVWTRPTDFNTGSIQQGSLVFIEAGTSYSASGWMMTSTDVVVGTNSQVWARLGATTPVVEVTGTSHQASVNIKYIANNAGLVTITLPTTAALGDQILIRGKGAGGWKLNQNANQVVHGSSDTTTGTGGSLASQTRYDTVTVECIEANNEWLITENRGTLTVV